MSTVRARLAIALAALASCAALAACGGDDTTANDAAATTSTASPSTATQQQSGEDSTTTQESGEDSGSPESRIAPDAEVAAGLKRLKGVGATAAAAGGGRDARDAVEEVWEPIEGTVKRNEPDLYLEVEDSFEQLSGNDAADAKRGAERLGQAVDAYLAKHPG